jgi:hypothetical protein
VTCERCFKSLAHGEHGHLKCPLEARCRSAAVIADDIPGGVEIAHGLCHDDGTPRRFYSKSEMRLAAQVKGLVPYHDVYAEGGNRVLSDARHRDDWLKSGEAQRAKRDRDESRRERSAAR